MERVDTLRACAGKSTNSVGPLIASTLTGRGNRVRVEDNFIADTLRGGVGRAPDHGHISVTPIQDAERTRVRRQNGIGIGSPGDPMYTGLTRGDHAVAFHATQDPISSDDRAPCRGTEPGCIGVLSFDEQQVTHRENRSRVAPGDPAPTLASRSRVDVLGSLRPRRLTPREWERLQGFPDDYTLVVGATDSNRYEALSNSMAVPVMRWIGKRLAFVDSLVAGAR